MNHPVRLRGPAGSGKSLTLELKAIREVLEARKSGRAIRIAYVTHSWALADEVDEEISQISENGRLPEIDVVPLLSLASEFMPNAGAATHMIGDDSLTSKQLTLEKIVDVLHTFRNGDWATFGPPASEAMCAKIENPDPEEVRALAWDLLVEFGCVLGADGIFPHDANSLSRYLRLQRAHWMMPLESDADRKVIFHLYKEYFSSLAEQGILSSDQVVVDFIGFLESHAWNIRRRKEGYDLILVDEFHFFNSLERMVLRYLTKDPGRSPKIIMALDPRQSAWGLYDVEIEASTVDSFGEQERAGFEGEGDVVLGNVHRSSPEILKFVQHVDYYFPNLDLPQDWHHLREVTSLADPGPVPSISVAEDRNGEFINAYARLRDLSSKIISTQIALAVIDPDLFDFYENIADGLSNKSTKFGVTKLRSRSDAASAAHRRRGLVIAPADYLAGLQFDTVLVAGVPDLSDGSAKHYSRRRSQLSYLYLALTRASREVHIFLNEDSGGLAPVFAQAAKQGLCATLPGVKA